MPLSTREVQEWLCLHGHEVAVDGVEGPATRAALRAFQRSRGPAAETGVGPNTEAALLRPMERALAPLGPPAPPDIRHAIVAVAHQHLAQEPREVGGPNRGPWVRLYCGGKDGPEWLWCAGFATYVLRQARATLGVSDPLDLVYPRNLSCDRIARAAMIAGRFAAAWTAAPEIGDLFLVRRESSDWIHTGVVVEVAGDHFRAIEGNTAADGGRNGDRVLLRTRAFRSDIDFVRTA